jgi:hypothetical protein
MLPYNMSMLEYISVVLSPFGFKALKHLLMMIAVWAFWVGAYAAWFWFLFVYVRGLTE